MSDERDRMRELLSKIRVVPDDEVPRDAWFVCMPVEAGPAYVPSAVTQCSKCGQDVWVSERAGVPQLERGLRAECMDCMIKEVEGARQTAAVQDE